MCFQLKPGQILEIALMRALFQLPQGPSFGHRATHALSCLGATKEHGKKPWAFGEC